MKVILVEHGSQTEIPLKSSGLSIGRSVKNDIRLSDERVSRHHCRLEVESSGVWVLDLGSANGTIVNGERVSRRRLDPGDRLQVGGATLELAEMEEGSPADERTQLLSARQRGSSSEVGMLTLASDAEREPENLRVFAHITRELARETQLTPLLRLIVDSAISMVGGERGFVLLRDVHAGRGADLEPEDFVVRVARNFEGEDIPIPTTRLSMGIARQMIRERKPFLSIDAGRDERFAGMHSVEELRLRSVMCLPITGEDGLEGLLYIDNRLLKSAFGQKDLDFVNLLALQASIAIRNARLVAELRERNDRLAHSALQIERLNEQLGRKVRDRDSELAVVRAELGRERGRYDYTSIVGASEGMRRVFQQLDRIIESELPVFIQGESGTGKELIARAIHFNGARRNKPFVTENCAALPDTLLESELFGHTRGAFTGAHRAKKGLLEQADGGTLFLDEIGDMSAAMQKKLLRVLQEGEFRLLGSNERVQVDVRVIAASHQDLERAVRENRFREDLYYRVNVLAVKLPPLRERREDIPLLAEHLLGRAAREANRPVPLLPREVLAALVAHDWPGNVRELENEMRRLVVLAEGDVRLELLSPSVLERRPVLESPVASHAGSAPIGGNIKEAVAGLERRAIEEALAQASGNKSRAAKTLGISRFALQRKLEKYAMSAERDDLDGSPEETPSV